MSTLAPVPHWMTRTPFPELTSAGFALEKIGSARTRVSSRRRVCPVTLVGPHGRCLTVDVDVATDRACGHFTIDHDPRSMYLLIAETSSAAIQIAQAAPWTPITVLAAHPDVSTQCSPV